MSEFSTFDASYETTPKWHGFLMFKLAALAVASRAIQRTAGYRALDLILTGRPVEAHEALQIGLVNRVVPEGKARETAIELAHQIAAFPQTCLRGDRMSAFEQFDLPFDLAMANEFKHGLRSLEKEAESGAVRFTRGAGRHGHFEKPDTDK